jgi:hypothetical protein
LVASSLLAWSCETTDEPAPNAVSSRLTENVAFLGGLLIPNGLPQATDDAVSLVQLGPATLLAPGGSVLLAFDVTDEEDGRQIAATLLQFEGENTHLRGPVEEGGGSSNSVVSNQLVVEDTLCNGLCDGVLSVNAQVAIELEDGGISEPIDIEIAVDCRGRGTEGTCPVEPGSDGNAPALICNDVTEGGAALTGDPQLDVYFDTLRTLALYSEQTEDAAQEALDEIRTALGDDAQDGIPNALEARIAEATEAGLLVLIGDPGCGIHAPRVSHTLRVCDDELSTEMSSMMCSGICEPGIDRNVCLEAEATGCRGVTEDGACEGTCLGACQVELAEPRACVGTCIGTCDGMCAGDEGSDTCEGPCSGMCDGECREPISEEMCAGLCTGMCNETTEGSEADPVPACNEPLNAFCSSASDQTLVCRGDCFGATSVAAGDPICQASALAMGALSARCGAPVVQVYYAFNTAGDADAQQAFSILVDEVNEPITNLLVLLDRIDLLEAAASELLAAEGAVTERLDSDLELTDESLECGQEVVTSSTPWLQDQIDLLQGLRDEILAIAAVLDTTGL